MNPLNHYNSPSTHLLYVILVTCFDLSPFCLSYDLSVSDTGEPAKEVVVLLTVPVHRNRARDKWIFESSLCFIYENMFSQLLGESITLVT